MPGVSGHDAKEYWAARLEADFSLRGTGHIEYSVGYNRWLYRAKARALAAGLERAGSPGPALDVGSGTGWCVRQLLQRGWSVTGCDVVPEGVERLKAEIPEARFVRTELGAAPLPLGDRSVGLVTALDVLYHLPDDQKWRSATLEIARVLEPGGILILTDGLGAEARNPAPHVRFRSQAQWKELAGAVGFNVEMIRPLYRWLSRDKRPGSWANRIPDVLRGAGEFALETVAPREPHMRLAVLRRA